MTINPTQSVTYKEPTKLIIRNTSGGMVWQSYTIKNDLEYSLLTETARGNGFGSIEVVSGTVAAMYDDDTFPGWRESEVWKERYSKALLEP